MGRVLGLNLLPDAIYPAMVAPYVEGNRGGLDTDSQPMIRVYWNMLEAIAGIPVMDHFEVTLFPLKIQLEREIGKKLFEYIFPGTDGGKNDSPFMVKQTLPGEEEDEGDNESLAESVHLGTADKDQDDASFTTRPGSLELRLRPTLRSDQNEASIKHKALSVHSGEGTSFRLFRSGTGFRSVNKKRSYDSLRVSIPKPGVGRTGTGLSSKDSVSVSGDSKKGSRFMLRHRSGEGDKAKQSDDLSKMMDRASSFMTFAYIKMPSVVLCLSYKGKGDRNFEDVHDFVFRLPTIEYRNKTWSNLDLALALKSRVIKALISHTGAIIGNKFSRHRPNTAQQSKLRELATSSVLLATPVAAESRDNSGDDSSSLYGHSPVDFSRSPPRSIRRSQTSIPIPSSASRSSSAASSMRSHLSGVAQGQGQGQGQGHAHVTVQTQTTGAVPSFLMAPPTPSATMPPEGQGLGGKGGGLSNLLRPASSGWSRPFNSSVGGNQQGNGGIIRPRSSGGLLTDSGSTSSPRRSGTSSTYTEEKVSPERRRTGGIGGGSGGLRDRIHALANRLKERENTVVQAGSGDGADEKDAAGEDGNGLARKVSRVRG